MNSLIRCTHTVHIVRSDDERSFAKDDIVEFFKKNPELEDVFGYVFSCPSGDTEIKIRQSVRKTFEELLKHSKFGNDLKNISPYCQFKSASSVHDFLEYGDEVESLKDSFEEAIGICESFESDQRDDWEKDVESLRSFYEMFMNDWIEGKDGSNFTFEDGA